MKSEKLYDHLSGSLARLERASQRIVKSQGYTEEVEKLRILAELIREQVGNEDPRPSARATR